jgi:iron-sulfur cluster repair protein YtfE (RIC family)
MASIETPGSLSERHEHFVPLVTAVGEAEAAVGGSSTQRLLVLTGALEESLAHELMPHAVGEGRAVFPVLRRVTGSELQAVEMTKQHRELARLTDELDEVRGSLGTGGTSAEAKIERILHRLRDVLGEHLAAEEEVCFTVLRSELTPEQAREVCAAMEQATELVRRNYE